MNYTKAQKIIFNALCSGLKAARFDVDECYTQIQANHAFELLKAEEAGLLVRLPCKPNDVWYEVDSPEHGVITHKCTSVYSGYVANDGLCGKPKNDGATASTIIYTSAVAEDGCAWPDHYNLDEFEKRIKTREKAEAALKGSAEND